MNTRLTLAVMIMTVLGLVGSIARGQPQPLPFTDTRTIPDTPACKRAVELAGLLKKGDEKAYIAYVQDHFAPHFRDAVPMDQHAEVFGDVLSTSQGGLEVYGVRTYDPPRPDTVCVLVLRNTLLGSWQAIVVEVDEDAPHKVAGVAFNPARPPTDAAKGARLNPEQVAAELNTLVDRLAAADVFSGTVLLAKDGKVLLSRAVGLANRDFNAPNTLDTKFNLGSMNKMMTGVAVMQLVEQGKVSLDDPIGKYLDESWGSKDVREKVKVKHLLTHTSGLGSYFNDTFMNGSRTRFRTVDDYKVLVRDETLAFEPGSQWSYSNTGMLLAGAVIEKAAGLQYTEYVRQHITGPAGMTGTDCYDLDHVNPNLAVGYQRRRTDTGVEYVNNIFIHVIRGGPAGGGYSTAPDLLRFDQALRTGKLLSAASMEQLWSPHPEVASPGYGYGFGIETTPAGKIVGHSGGFVGISSNLSMYLDEGYTVVTMSNYGGSSQLVETKARELITQGR